MSQTDWPRFERVPTVAFVDVDGTLLAQTTTFFFARILYRKGWIRRSFFLRALYHGLQHRFGRLDYGRLIGIGMTYISGIPVAELERIAYEKSLLAPTPSKTMLCGAVFTERSGKTRGSPHQHVKFSRFTCSCGSGTAIIVIPFRVLALQRTHLHSQSHHAIIT